MAVDERQITARIFGRAIRTQRLTQGLTQDELVAAVLDAAAADGRDLTLTKSAVSRWEAGRWVPAMRYRPFIAAALEVDQRVLFPDLAVEVSA